MGRRPKRISALRMELRKITDADRAIMAEFAEDGRTFVETDNGKHYLYAASNRVPVVAKINFPGDYALKEAGLDAGGDIMCIVSVITDGKLLPVNVTKPFMAVFCPYLLDSIAYAVDNLGEALESIGEFLSLDETGEPEESDNPVETTDDSTVLEECSEN